MRTEHEVVFGEALQVLRMLPSRSVHCVCTSPPYWGLREYGTGEWIGGDPDCDHVMKPGQATGNKGHVTTMPYRAVCGLCGAIRVDTQVGLEETPQQYIERLVVIFREVRRVLRDDGTLWLIIGDSYARDAAKGQHRPGDSGKQSYVYDPGGGRASATCSLAGAGLKPKDLCMIPARLALALQADGAADPTAMSVIDRLRGALIADYGPVEDEWPQHVREEMQKLDAEYGQAHEGGWWLRQDIIWAKAVSGVANEYGWHGTTMPESVKDRPTTSHEHVLLLTKSQRYWYDYYAAREPGAYSAGRNMRSVWTIMVEPQDYGDEDTKHYAAYPRELVRRILVAACPPKVCAECGEPHEHRLERAPAVKVEPTAGKQAQLGKRTYTGFNARWSANRRRGIRDLGYHSACACGTDEWLPGTVLDPFLGSGTTTEVAWEMGRRSLGIELQADYEAVIRDRLASALRRQPGMLFNADDLGIKFSHWSEAQGGGLYRAPERIQHIGLVSDHTV